MKSQKSSTRKGSTKINLKRTLSKLKAYNSKNLTNRKTRTRKYKDVEA